MNYEEACNAVIKSLSQDKSLVYYSKDYIYNDTQVAHFKFLEKNSFAPGMSDDENMPGYIKKNQVITVEDQDKKIIAWVFFRKISDNEMCVDDLVVAPDHQQRRLGRQLLGYVFDIAELAKIKYVTLESPAYNYIYYRERGFQVLRNQTVGFFAKSLKLLGFDTRPIWPVSVRKGDAIRYRLHKLTMCREAESKENAERERKQERAASRLPDPAIIWSVLRFGQLLQQSTSVWYSNHFRSDEKGRSLDAMVESLRIYLSGITQKRTLTEPILASILGSFTKPLQSACVILYQCK